MPTPDTSNANVARVLRHLAAHLNHRESSYGTRYADAYALADALEQRDGPTVGLTKAEWKRRVEAATLAYSLSLVDLPFRSEADFHRHHTALREALAAAFPLLAPSDD